MHSFKMSEKVWTVYFKEICNRSCDLQPAGWQVTAFYYKISYTPPRTARISNSWNNLFGLKIMVESDVEFFILKLSPLRDTC